MGITKNEKKKIYIYIWDSQKMGATASTTIWSFKHCLAGVKMEDASILRTHNKQNTSFPFIGCLSVSVSISNSFSFSALLRPFYASSFSHFNFIFITIMSTVYSFIQFKYLLLSLLLLQLSTSSSASAYIFSGISILFFFFFRNITPNIHIK